MPEMKLNNRIYVAGHNGMVGSAVVRLLQKNGYQNLLLKSRSEFNLLDSAAVKRFFDSDKPDVVVLAAARVGGIKANIEHSAEFLYENLVIQNNIIHQAYLNGVKKLCFLGSSCIYPKECIQPMKEEYLFHGPLEPTNEGYAVAKIAGLKMVELYRRQYGMQAVSLMPCNLYGTNDSFDPEHSHVLSALVKKMVDAARVQAPNVSIWGTGQARREFMHVDDAALAILYFLDHLIEAPFINVGWGVDISIRELAEKIARFSGYEGDLLWDSSKPDGMMRKCMDVSKMKRSGFIPQITLDDGIKMMIEEYRQLSNSTEETDS